MKHTLVAAILGLLVILAVPATSTAVVYTGTANSLMAVPPRLVYSASQTLTEAVPTSATTDGILVPPNLVGCFVTAQAQAGATVTNLVLTAYLYDPVVGLWGKANLSNVSPSANGTAAAVGTINVASVGDRTWATILPSSFAAALPRGSKLDFVSTGSTVSAGTAITVFLSCW